MVNHSLRIDEKTADCQTAHCQKARMPDGAECQRTRFTAHLLGHACYSTTDRVVQRRYAQCGIWRRLASAPSGIRAVSVCVVSPYSAFGLEHADHIS
jgi:hypothetical protein